MHKEKKYSIYVYTDLATREKLKVKSASDGRSVSKQVEFLIKKYLRK